MSITVVTGPACAGKSTFVFEHCAPADLVIDLDVMAAALGYPEPHVRFDDDHPAVHAARAARAYLIRSVIDRRLGGLDSADVWIIDAAPTDAQRIKYLKAGATIELIDPGIEVCLERAAERDSSTADRVRTWYLEHQAHAEALGLFD